MQVVRNQSDDSDKLKIFLSDQLNYNLIRFNNGDNPHWITSLTMEWCNVGLQLDSTTKTVQLVDYSNSRHIHDVIPVPIN